MNRPKWLRPRVGQNRRRPGTRDADIRREEELRQAEREAEGTPGHRSFRQEMRAARLRQEEAKPGWNGSGPAGWDAGAARSRNLKQRKLAAGSAAGNRNAG